VFVKPEEVKKSFGAAWDKVAAEHPNYGKDDGLNPEDWWAELVHATFKPLVGSCPKSLPVALIKHYASSNAYTLHPAVTPLLDSLRANKKHDQTVIGVISNCDPRVPFILRSLGIAVRNYQTKAPPSSVAHLEDTPSENPVDFIDGINGSIDFLTLSYDVGVEKPHKEIFDAAERKVASLPEFESDGSWDRVHIGDDIEKDVEAAEQAGWKGIPWGEDTTADGVLHEIFGCKSN